MGSIEDQNLLRVGYNDNYTPSCVFNKKGPLAGYEMEMAHDLVCFLGTGRIEFIPITRGNLCGALNHGTCDIIMSPTTGNSDLQTTR
jgi:ABC-type amino acid transport substrate-binding protein